MSTHVGNYTAIQELENSTWNGLGDRVNAQGRTQSSQFMKAPARCQISTRIAIAEHVRDNQAIAQGLAELGKIAQADMRAMHVDSSRGALESAIRDERVRM